MLREQLEVRERALERQEAELRQARERAAKIAAALAAAGRAPSHEAAVGILEAALPLDPTHGEVNRRLEERRAAWQEEVRQARERREQVAAAIAQAKATASHAEAIATLEGARALDPADAKVERLLAERRGALAREEEAARRAREREAAIAAALAEAEATADHAAAIEVLRRGLALDEGHRILREQLEVRERALERQEAELRQARERAAKIAAALAAAGRAPSHEAAVGILEAALPLDPTHAEVNRQIEKRRAAWQEEVRQARERREQVAAAIAQAKATASHAEAIATLEGARALDPADAEVGRLLAERRGALAREEEAARRAREREAAIAAALAKARQTAAHDAAIQILERASALDSSNVELQRELAARHTARERALEETRRERERKEAIAAALKKARQTASDEAAVAILTEALALEPSHPEMRGQLAKRETALQRARAEAAREQELANVREKVLQLVSNGQFDAAAAALNDAEARLSARKALKDVSRSLARARVAAGERPEASSAVDRWAAAAFGRFATRVRVQPSHAAAAALILVSLLGVATYFIAGRSPDDVPTAASEPVVPAGERPLSADGTALPDSGASQPLPVPVPTLPPPAVADIAPGAGAVPDAAPGATGAAPGGPQPAVAAALLLAQQQVARGDLRAALSTAAGGLKTEPQNAELQALVVEVAARARQQALTARTAAVRLGDTATALSAFRDGEATMTEAQAHARAGRPVRAAESSWDAADLFASAAREAGEARRRAAATPTPVPAPSEPPPAVAARDEPELGKKPIGAPPPPSAPAPAAPVASPPAVSPEPSPPTEEAAIRAALRAYEQAYIALDVAAVKRIYPTVNEAALQRSFRDMLAQEVQIEAERISISGTTAVVTGRVRQSFTPRAGTGRSDVIASVFRLEKMGDRWVIVERR
jgi:hypothetical protein